MAKFQSAAGRGFNASRKVRGGFTLIEIMIVVSIIGILLSIAAFNLAHAREKVRSKACAGNLRRIQWAKDCWLMDNNQPITASPTSDVLYGTDSYIKSEPFCPESGVYTIGSGSEDPACSIGGEHNVNATSL